MKLPTDPAEKKQLWNELKAQAPSLVGAINTLRERFPDAKVCRIKLADGTEYADEDEASLIKNSVPLSVILKEKLELEEWDRKHGAEAAEQALRNSRRPTRRRK